MTNDYRITAQIDAAAINGASESADHIIIRTTGGGAGANRFAFSFRKPEEFGRNESHGPILSGPRLAGFGVGTCIHNGPVSARAPELHLETGDVIRIRNLVERGYLRTFDFRLTVNRGYPKFECISARRSKMGNASNIDIEVTEITREEYSDYLDVKFQEKYGEARNTA